MQNADFQALLSPKIVFYQGHKQLTEQEEKYLAKIPISMLKLTDKTNSDDKTNILERFYIV